MHTTCNLTIISVRRPCWMRWKNALEMIFPHAIDHTHFTKGGMNIIRKYDHTTRSVCHLLLSTCQSSSCQTPSFQNSHHMHHIHHDKHRREEKKPKMLYRVGRRFLSSRPVSFELKPVAVGLRVSVTKQEGVYFPVSLTAVKCGSVARRNSSTNRASGRHPCTQLQ